MKKTLIALALATTAVSGSAMAWTPNGVGGTMEFGGTLSPKEAVNPWEVKVGSATGLNGSLKPNEQKTEITLTKGVLFLGIRTTENKAFTAISTGMAPVINYGGKVDLDTFNAGVTTFNVDVLNAVDSTKIGTLTAPFTVANAYSRTDPSRPDQIDWNVQIASNSGALMFSGGIAKDSAGALPLNNVDSVINAMDPTISANFDTQGIPKPPDARGFGTGLYNGWKYSAYYGAGLNTGAKLVINLDKPATADIAWKATFPVTVSYQ